MLLTYVPLTLHLSSHSILLTNQRSKSLTINPQTHKTITAKSHSSSPSSSPSSLTFNQTLGVHPLQPTNEPPNNISREVDGSGKGDKKKGNKRRVFLLDVNPLCYNGSTPSLDSFAHWVSLFFSQVTLKDPVIAIVGREVSARMPPLSTHNEDFPLELLITEDIPSARRQLTLPSVCGGVISCLAYTQVARASVGLKIDAVYEIGELFELGIQLSYLLLLLGLLGVGTFFVIRQVLVRRELDLSAKELQEQVRSGDASATELFELGAVMLRRKFYPAATKYLLQAIEKWDGDDQDLAQVHNALGVSYVRDGKLEKGIAQFESAVKLQPGYVTAWNNLGDAYEKNKDMKSALKAFEEVLLFDPNNKIARPRRDALKEKVQMYKGVAVKTKQK